jgi:prepilin-type N-terminal cleavage/methylation domain-containing protein
VNAHVRRYAKSQGGYTLVEVIVASAIGLMIMTGLTSVVLTSTRAGAIATSRIEASAQVRNFQFDANGDFALSGVPTIISCAPGDPSPCSITLTGQQASNSVTPVASSYQVTYTWDGSNIDRQVGSNPPTHIATGVKAFSAVLSGTAPYQTVIVTMTVQVLFSSSQTYAETQALRFYPRVNP